MGRGWTKRTLQDKDSLTQIPLANRQAILSFKHESGDFHWILRDFLGDSQSQEARKASGGPAKFLGEVFRTIFLGHGEGLAARGQDADDVLRLIYTICWDDCKACLAVQEFTPSISNMGRLAQTSGNVGNIGAQATTCLSLSARSIIKKSRRWSLNS